MTRQIVARYRLARNLLRALRPSPAAPRATPPDKRSEDWIIQNTLPPALSSLLLSKSLDLASMARLYFPFHLNAIESIVLFHGSMTSRGE